MSGGAQVHSIRLPGFTISAEAIFGMPDQTLTIRHDAGNSAVPYVDGALIAIRRVATLVGVHRGLDTVPTSDGGQHLHQPGHAAWPQPPSFCGVTAAAA